MTSKFGIQTHDGTSPNIHLLHVRSEVLLVESIAEVKIFQEYVNRESKTISGKYVFPLDANSAICKFVMQVGERKIIGKAIEKAEARKVYETAVKKGKTASLLDQNTNDIFIAEIGNIHPNENIKIEFTYLVQLLHEPEMLRFILPCAITPRYGDTNLPATSDAAFSFHVNISVCMASRIKSLHSPTHKIDKVTSGTNGTVSFFSDTPLSCEFVVQLELEDPFQTRCVLENFNGSRALMLSFLPKFNVTPRPIEAIVILDRSGSMGGININAAKQALNIFLASLPESSYFNIISFGSSCKLMFKESVQANPTNIAQAQSEICKFQANMGGTEILHPLRKAVQGSRIPEGFPREIFLITDGAVSKAIIDSACDIIKQHSDSVRVFSLGIGLNVCHELVDSLAKCGNGVSMYCVPSGKYSNTSNSDASDNDNLTSKISALLNYSTQPALKNLKLSFGQETPDLPGHHTPFVIPPIYNGRYFVLYYLFGNISATKLPTQICVKALGPEGPVTTVLPIVQEKEIRGTLLHTLAAKSIIRDLESKRGYMDSSASSQAIKEEVLKYALKFQLSSSYSSFVAVAEHEEIDHLIPEQPIKNLGRSTVSTPLNFLQNSHILFDPAPGLRDLKRSSILAVSAPFNCQHSIHVGFNSETGFSGLPVEYEVILKTSGISCDEARANPDLLLHILDCMNAKETKSTASISDRDDSIIAEMVSKGSPLRNYSNVTTVGQGAAGCAYTATVSNSESKETVSITKFLFDKTLLRLLAADLKIMKSSKCPHVVNFQEVYVENGEIWLIKESQSGVILTDVFEAFEMNSCVLKEAEIACLVKQIVTGLMFIHANYGPMGEISSDMIFICDDGTVKISGVGHAHNHNRKSNRVGCCICAPELYRKETATEKVDVWVLGLLLYEMIQLEPPYIEYPPLRAIYTACTKGIPGITSPTACTADVLDCLVKCTQLEPKLRPTLLELINHPFLSHACSPQELSHLVEQSKSAKILLSSTNE